jgi:DNA invertase Pin-like site-specific DNA recombinase
VEWAKVLWTSLAMNARAVVTAQTLRCAIYTRKSSDEGLERSFNSLDAQREACAAYIKSQAHQGWVCLSETYDDGGFSGGSMDRPALRRLLADIQAGKIDTVAIYKIDRLTRSLTDFAKIVEIFDAAGASFVSITQSFNTTTSMGRLTLNVLLSFAQFEREVTGERIRDKIAASKAKGMWMGGVLPLGYDSRDQALVVNEAEAAIVRQIFERYLKLGSVHALCAELERRGVRSKAWLTKAGRPMGGKVFDRGALYHLLQNRHYVGEIRHKERTHPGRHPAIVETKLFEAAQRKLANNRVKRRERPTRASAAPLGGKIADHKGRPYSPTFSIGRAGRRYAYYVLSDLQQGLKTSAAPDAPARLPAAALEAAVLAHLRRLADRPEASWAEIGPMLRRLEVRPKEARLLLEGGRLFGADHPELALEDLRSRLNPGERAVMSGGGHPTVTVAIPGKLQFRGGGAWQSEPAGRSRIDPVLVRALKAAHRILGEAGLSPAAVPANGRFKHGGRTKELRSARALCRALATTAVITETQ